MEWSPVLRPELAHLANTDGSEEALSDPLLGHHVDLGPLSASLIDRMDGRPLKELLDDVCAAHPERPRGVIEHSLRTLLTMNLLDVPAGHDIRARALSLRRGDESLQPVMLPEARFACQGSGACCHNYALGPLLPADLARLSGQDIQAHFPELGPGPYTEERTPRDGTSGHFLRTRGGSCVFQRDDARCGIHGAFGFDQKPRMCRVFPLQDVPTVLGLRIYDRGECTRFGKSARSGTRFADDLPRILALLGEHRTLFHPLVLLDSATPCDYGYFLQLQDALCALVRARLGDTLQTLRAAAALLHAFCEEVAACPLAPEEPARTVAALLGRDPGSFFLAPEAPDADALRLLGTIAGDLLAAVLPTILHGDRGPDEYLAVRDLEHFAGIVHSIETLSVYRADGDRVDAFHERVLAVAEDGPDLDEALRLSLQNQLFGLRLLIKERPRAGMLRVGLTYLIAVLGAKRLAARDQADRVREEDFSASHSLAMRILHREGVRDVFLENEARFTAVLSAIPYVLLAAP